MMTQLENAAMKYEVPPHILVMEDDLSVARGWRWCCGKTALT
jgi:hypothetical protein